MQFFASVRRHFPFVKENIAYLDSAATAQMPLCAIDAMRDAAMRGLGNVHRGLHPFADRATELYEHARATVASFLGARPSEIVFTKNATESINLAAHAIGEQMTEGDAVVVTALEHHSNLLPWYRLAKRRGVDVRMIGVTNEGMLKQGDIDAAFRDERVRIIAATGQSNVLGTRPELPALTALAKRHGARICVDAAQLAAHDRIDIASLGWDLMVFSGHKAYGPTGIGVLYAEEKLLQSLPPFLVGGGIVRSVTSDGFLPADAPARFEAGTPPILPAIGLAAALEWQQTLSWDDRRAHERSMLDLLLSELRSIPAVRLLGPGNESTRGCISFTVKGVHAHDIAEVLGSRNVCVRAGHHCAQPLHDALGIQASVRASVGLYTSEDDVRALKPALEHAITLFS